MAEYQIVQGFEGEPDGYRRASDGAAIPGDPSNRDYQIVQVWIAAGNEPDPPEGD